MSHQVPDLLHVAAVIKERAAHVADSRSAPTSSVSHGSKTKRHKISEIWTSVYSAAALTQACIVQFSAQRGGTKHLPAFLCAAGDYIRSDICLVRKHMISRPVLEAEEFPVRRV